MGTVVKATEVREPAEGDGEVGEVVKSLDVRLKSHNRAARFRFTSAAAAGSW